MMKKHLILYTGLLIALFLLLFMAPAAVAQTDGQPSKSAEQWASEGCQIINLADTAYGKDAEGFIALRKDINYLKETMNGSYSVNGNTLTCTYFAALQTGSGEFASTYCILAGRKIYFGEKDDAASNGNTVVLKNISAVDSLNQASYMGMTVYTLGAWIDHTFDIDYKTTDPTEPPIVIHGPIHFYLDHWSVDPGPTEATKHTLRIYMDANMDTMSLESDTVVHDAAYDVGILSWEHIPVVSAELSLEDFIGKINFKLTSHYGETLTWKSLYVKLSDFDLEYDDNNGTNCDMNEMNVKGKFRYELALGPRATADFYIFSVTLGWTINFGIIMVPTDPPDKFSPADTKVNWHVCDECIHSNLCPVIGPGVFTLKFESSVVDFDKRWPSDEIILDPFYDFYYSNTFADYGEGSCPHYGYRLDVNARNQDGTPLKNVAVTYETVPAHYGSESSASTNAAGLATLYPPADKVTVKAKLASPRQPGKTMSLEQEIIIARELNRINFDFDIPKKTVSFKNADTGKASDWPEDITFIPFYSEDVKLPDNIPSLSGRVFKGWNTQKDGSGTAYAPGTKLILKDDLTLWAQWELAGDSWYVIYNANGGTEAPDPQIVPRGQDAVLSKEAPKAETMVFKGWTPDLEKLDPIYQPGDTLPYDSEKNMVVLYARWDLSPVSRPIHISFEANGGQKASLPADVWLEQAGWLQLKQAVAPVGSSYRFRGWSEDPNAQDPEYLAGESYYFDKDTVLYAIWDQLKTVTLTFLDSLPDAASDIPAPITIKPSVSRNVQIPDQIPKKSGRVFTGWNTAQDGSGTTYAPGAIFTLVKSTTLWAQWEITRDKWYVVYNANGGTKAPRTQIIPRGEDAVLTTEVPENGEMIFKGWTTDPNRKKAEYQPGDTLRYDSTKNYVVLYALWNLDPAPRPVVISFDANGGLPGTVPGPVSAVKNVWFRLPEERPSWDAQHDFVGWATDPEATKAAYEAGELACFEKDTTLYAVWHAHYKVIEGGGSVWIKGSGKTQRFVADGNVKYFVELRVDGLPFNEGVEISSGTTVADISAKAMEKLSNGDHTVTFVYQDGIAAASFTVRPKTPPTGDAGRPGLWIALIALGIAGLVLPGVLLHTKGRKK